MSRHRLVREIYNKSKYDQYKYDNDNDVSEEDEDQESEESTCPEVKQWMFDREHNQRNLSSFFASVMNRKIEDENDLPSELDFEESVLEASTNNSIEVPEKFTENIGDQLKSPTPTPVKEIKNIGDHLKTPNPNLIKETKKNVKTVAPKLLEGVRGNTLTKPLPAQKSFKEKQKVHLPGDSVKISKEQAHRNPQQLYARERAQQKCQLHMIVIGHVDAGKSTLMGHLLYDTGNVSQRVMKKYEQESKKAGKQSFMYAWVLDESGEERARGITMDVGHSRIETKTKLVTLLDAPGHKDFIPNMISGATQADCALLVVDATVGEFESGFELGGQTREHALLVRSLGVSQLGVVVNKLDTIQWAQYRFDEIVYKLQCFLKQVGYKGTNITFIPCSGLKGENLAKPANAPELTAWYKGPCLLEIIDNFKEPVRAIDRPFRISVVDNFRSSATGSLAFISGRIESGVLCFNDKVLVGSNHVPAQVKGLLIDDVAQRSVFAGDQVSLTLTGIDMSNISVGYIICDPQHPIPVAQDFQARIVIFNLKVPITNGYLVLLHHQSLIEPAIIRKVTAEIHKSTGEVVKKKPRCLNSNMCALVEIQVMRPICIELYADCKNLGRFMLRVSGVTIAAGIVTKIRGNKEAKGIKQKSDTK